MKTNELSLQEMQQTNGGLTIRNIPETGNAPVVDTAAPNPDEQPVNGGMFNMWDQSQNTSGDVSPV